MTLKTLRDGNKQALHRLAVASTGCGHIWDTELDCHNWYGGGQEVLPGRLRALLPVTVGTGCAMGFGCWV